MAHSLALKSTAEEFFDECPRFRILTTGKTGVGKTTLIKYAFNVGELQGSDKDPGKCDINEEIYSTENTRFVLHDSQGFEPGENENFNKVKHFIQERARKPEIKDQLHAIWLCIRIPQAGGSLIEEGDEKLLQLDFGDVPVIIVFTQYDALHNYIDFKMPSDVESLDEAQRKSYIGEEANKYFKKECVERLKTLVRRPKKLEWVKVSKEDEYRHTFIELVQTTYKLVRNHVAESVWVATATAQRVDVDLNVESSIRVGMKKYWRSLASSTHFSGNPLRDCLGVIHDDIVQIWNFLDPEAILGDTSFKAMILGLVQDLAESDVSNPNSGFKGNLESIKAALDVATPISGPIAPVIATVGLSVAFANWLFGVYRNTPGTLRSLMGYIVDLTIVLEGLFWLMASQPRNRVVSADDVEAAFHLYNNSEERANIHREIRGYVDSMSLLDHAHPDNAHEEVQRLISSNRRDFIGANKSHGVS